VTVPVREEIPGAASIHLPFNFLQYLD
jgi:hypothetical protein